MTEDQVLNTLPNILAAAGTGLLLGLAFFRGLEFTVNRLVGARHPVAWMLGSLALRFGLVLAGIYLVARLGGWPGVIAATAGFTLARAMATRRARHASRGEGASP